MTTPQCPIGGNCAISSALCPGRRVHRFCELVRSGHAEYRTILLAEAERSAAAGLTTLPVTRRSPGSPIGSTTISDPGWRERRIARLIHSCLYRGPEVETGCNCRRHCYAGKGEDGLVRVEDCRACVGTLAIEDNRPNSHPDPSKV